jgi:hypothetical protein
MKKKTSMQNVSFESLDEFFGFIPEHERAIVEVLRETIFECIPGCREKLSYNVPFYSRYAGICFIWPSSVTWGNVRNKGVRLGFNKGYLLQDEIGYLDRGGRKQVYCRDFDRVSEIDTRLLRSYLFQAAEIDMQVASRKKKKDRAWLI